MAIGALEWKGWAAETDACISASKKPKHILEPRELDGLVEGSVQPVLLHDLSRLRVCLLGGFFYDPPPPQKKTQRWLFSFWFPFQSDKKGVPTQKNDKPKWLVDINLLLAQ